MSRKNQINSDACDHDNDFHLYTYKDDQAANMAAWPCVHCSSLLHCSSNEMRGNSLGRTSGGRSIVSASASSTSRTRLLLQESAAARISLAVIVDSSTIHTFRFSDSFRQFPRRGLSFTLARLPTHLVFRVRSAAALDLPAKHASAVSALREQVAF